MPFNKEKRIRLPEFLERVQKRIKAQGHSQVLIFFEVFVQQGIVQKLVDEAGADPNLAQMDVAAGDFDVIYNVAAQILHDAASRNFSEVHPDTYQDANAVSEALCAELNEYFECSGKDGLFDLIPIKSYVEMAMGVDPAHDK